MDIDAIFLDIGNTLRILMKEEPYREEARQKIAALVGTSQPPQSFSEELDRRYKEYRKWAFEHLVEASEEELWTRWLVPEFPAQHIAPLAHELTYQFRQSMGRRVMAALQDRWRILPCCSSRYSSFTCSKCFVYLQRPW